MRLISVGCIPVVSLSLWNLSVSVGLYSVVMFCMWLYISIESGLLLFVLMMFLLNAVSGVELCLMWVVMWSLNGLSILNGSWIIMCDFGCSMCVPLIFVVMVEPLFSFVSG